MDITQPDRDTELALPAESPNVGVGEIPSMPQSAIEATHLDWLEKLGWR